MANAPEQTRGIRNNNPLNIRHGSKWRGLANKQTDECFCTFVNMHYGLRAAFRLMGTYMFDYRCKTIADIISKWAPPSENNTQNYIRLVSERTHIAPNVTLDFYNFYTIASIVNEMSFIESRYTPSPIDLYEAYCAAR